MPKALIHVGMPRTGSTSLQHVLYHNPRLVKQAGYSYFNGVASPSHLSHLELWRILASSEEPGAEFDKRFSRFVNAVNDQSRETETVVIVSCEPIWFNWFRLPERAKEAFTDAAHVCDWQGIGIVRLPDDFSRSAYAYCRNQDTMPYCPEMGFSGSYKAFQRMPGIRNVYAWPSLLEAMQLAFPVFNYLSYQKEGMVNYFFKQVLNWLGPVPEPRLNPSIGIEESDL